MTTNNELTRFLWIIIISALTISLAVAATCLGSVAECAEPLEASERGYRFLTEKEYLPPDFHQFDFDRIWEVWPRGLKAEAKAASPEKRREMAFDRYGLTPRPDDPSGRPLQYVVDAQGNWTMNCLACHGGSVFGMAVPGAPNNAYGLQCSVTSK